MDENKELEYGSYVFFSADSKYVITFLIGLIVFKLISSWPPPMGVRIIIIYVYDAEFDSEQILSPVLFLYLSPFLSKWVECVFFYLSMYLSVQFANATQTLATLVSALAILSSAHLTLTPPRVRLERWGLFHIIGH